MDSAVDQTMGGKYANAFRYIPVFWRDFFRTT